MVFIRLARRQNGGNTCKLHFNKHVRILKDKFNQPSTEGCQELLTIDYHVEMGLVYACKQWGGKFPYGIMRMYLP